MSFVEQLSAIALLVDFLLGVTSGVVGSASLASRREDRAYSLLHAAPGPVSGGVRALHGVYSRGDGFVSDALRRGVPPDDDGHGDDGGSGAHGQESDR
jgi:hypothetical protein